MTVAPLNQWTADAFMAADQHAFGDAWRYELVEGRIVGHAAPSPEHAAIVAGLTGALARDRPNGCRPEVGSAAAPRSAHPDTARIPDVMVRCGAQPRAVFDIVSQSDMADWRGSDLKRRHLQGVEGVREIVELSEVDFAARIYRAAPDGGWIFDSLGGPDAVLRLDSIAITIPLSEIYAFAEIARAELA